MDMSKPQILPTTDGKVMEVVTFAQEVFEVFTVEETGSKSVSVLWRTKFCNSLKPSHIAADIYLTETMGCGDQAFTKNTYFLRCDGVSKAINETVLPFVFTPGMTYILKMALAHTCHLHLPPVETTFIKRYGKHELEMFYHKALILLGGGATLLKFMRLPEFYRNKPGEYYSYIRTHRRGVMEVYRKDENGHRGSPINGAISGLFFSARATPDHTSFYGDTRLHVRAQEMLNADANLYMADFYCYNLAHYVTLVVTKKHTEADSFCKKRLLELNKMNNNFLVMKPEASGKGFTVLVNCSRKILVEVLYTESMKIFEPKLGQDLYRMTKVTSNGSSTPGGITRSKLCAVCDIDGVVW